MSQKSSNLQVTHSVPLVLNPDTLFTNLAVKAAHNFNGGSQYKLAASDYLKLALKAQNQSRMTFETLATVKNPQVVFTKQANINNGGQQQVNNGTGPSSHAQENKTSPNKILDSDNG